MAAVYNKGRQEQAFQVGDRVYFTTQNLAWTKVDWPLLRHHAYKLGLPPGLKLHPVFNTGALKLYETPSRLTKPRPVVLRDGEISQLVDAIVGKRKRLKVLQYLPTWEQVKNLHQVSGLIKDFEDLTRRTRKRKRS
uniref:Chromo domain-containing protein n=1 Tax=Globisporangium ultimum (strain ATCC 200006 / CBS 805.95 / DAOM BR144) TaxID=431595 RepID=K3XBD1_GLOUD